MVILVLTEKEMSALVTANNNRFNKYYIQYLSLLKEKYFDQLKELFKV